MYLEDVELAFGSNLTPGMNKVAKGIDKADAGLRV